MRISCQPLGNTLRERVHGQACTGIGDVGYEH